MDFAYADEDRMLADALGARLAAETHSWAEVIEASGVSLLGIPEKEGGLGTDPRAAAVVAATLGRAGAALPWAEHWIAVRGGARGEGPLDPADVATSDWAEDAIALLHSAEIVGLCRTMMRDTARFLHQRSQFGVAIAGFQVLRHRMTDMAMALELADAAVDGALDTLDGTAEERVRTVSAARVLAEEAGRIVGEGAVQLHGAMGLTAELRVGGYFRRARELMQCDGTARRHLRRYAAARSTPRR